MEKQYIITHEELQKLALEKLGEMTADTAYNQFMEKARLIATRQGVLNPSLMLAMKYKPDMNTAQLAIIGERETINVEMERPSAEVVYPIADFEWEDFARDIPTYLVENPTVWVVDGDKFTAPI